MITNLNNICLIILMPFFCSSQSSIDDSDCAWHNSYLFNQFIPLDKNKGETKYQIVNEDSIKKVYFEVIVFNSVAKLERTYEILYVNDLMKNEEKIELWDKKKINQIGFSYWRKGNYETLNFYSNGNIVGSITLFSKIIKSEYFRRGNLSVKYYYKKGKIRYEIIKYADCITKNKLTSYGAVRKTKINGVCSKTVNQCYTRSNFPPLKWFEKITGVDWEDFISYLRNLD